MTRAIDCWIECDSLPLILAIGVWASARHLTNTAIHYPPIAPFTKIDSWDLRSGLIQRADPWASIGIVLNDRRRDRHRAIAHDIDGYPNLSIDT